MTESINLQLVKVLEKLYSSGKDRCYQWEARTKTILFFSLEQIPHILPDLGEP